MNFLNKILITSLVGFTLVAAETEALAANLIQNGGFEDLTAEFFDGVDPSDWDISEASISGVDAGAASLYSSSEGEFVAAFNSGDVEPSGILSQTFDTLIGQQYTLEFDYGVFSFIGSSQSLLVELDGLNGKGSLLSNTIQDSGTPTTTFETFSFSFIADSTSTILRFSDVLSNNTASTDFVLDRVSVTAHAVPEPISVLGTITAAVFGIFIRKK